MPLCVLVVFHTYVTLKTVRRLESVHRLRYFRFCNVLHIWTIRAIPTYRVYRLYDILVEQSLLTEMEEHSAYLQVAVSISVIVASLPYNTYPILFPILVVFLSIFCLCCKDKLKEQEEKEEFRGSPETSSVAGSSYGTISPVDVNRYPAATKGAGRYAAAARR